MKLTITSLAIITLITFSCKKKHGHHDEAYNSNHQGSMHNEAQKHMHQMKFSELVKRFEDPKRVKWQKPDQVINSLNIKKGMKIADIGAGTGYFTRRFAVVAGANNVTGFDPNDLMLNEMKNDATQKTHPYKYTKVDFKGTQLHNEKFDLIFICDVNHHIDNRIIYYKNLLNSLTKNGRLILIDFKKKKMKMGPPLKMKIFEADVIKEMKQAGYRVLKSHKFLKMQYMLEFTRI